MKVLALILLALVAFTAVKFMTSTETVDSEMVARYNQWKITYGKRFDSNEAENYRFAVFSENYNWIEAQNAAQDETQYGENQFMDLTQEEFKSTYLGLLSDPIDDDETEEVAADLTLGDVDWRDKGAVTDIKDQGQCGSCWAFSTTGSMEGLSFLRDGTLLNLSESQLVDCSRAYGNQGCNGGLMDNAFRYIIKYGSAAEKDYPYVPVTRTCKQFTPVFKMSQYKDVPRGNVNQLQKAVTDQPVSIAVDANNWSFYRGGVFSNCGRSLDHGVLAVGFTSEYWIVKNSWGKGWGEQGYIRLKMGNTCGCAQQSSYPVK